VGVAVECQRSRTEERLDCGRRCVLVVGGICVDASVTGKRFLSSILISRTREGAGKLTYIFL
jgi:hypothetical protein